MSPDRQTSPERQAEKLDWSKLIEEALNAPGGLGNTYNRFYEYSFMNQILLWSQGVNEPVATYKRWLEMGRQVKKGSKAKAILRPIAFKAENEKGELESRVKGFKMVNCLFTASETDGEPLPDVTRPDWNPLLAMDSLGIEQIDFNHLNGNIQGYSVGKNFAINPVAKYPVKTTFHELGHIVLGHTSPDKTAEYEQHRGVQEFQAEAVAYICLNELEALDSFDASESRGYIQSWLGIEHPNDAAIREVFTAANSILKAGRP